MEYVMQGLKEKPFGGSTVFLPPNAESFKSGNLFPIFPNLLLFTMPKKTQVHRALL
jgi:hypothetical protein